MKVAFVFSGIIRDLDITTENLCNKINEIGADVYGSFWDIEEDNNTVCNFVKNFKPRKIEVESWSDFQKSTLVYHQEEISFPQDLNPNFYEAVTSAKSHAMWYRIWRGNLLTKSSEYDIVVRLRTDLLLSEQFKLQINDYLNFPHGGCLITSWKNCYGPHDLIVWGKPEFMDYFSMVYQNLSKYISEGQYYFPPENILRHHLSLKDLKLRFYADKVLLRDGGNSRREQLDLPEEIINSLDWRCEPLPEFSFKR